MATGLYKAGSFNEMFDVWTIAERPPRRVYKQRLYVSLNARGEFVLSEAAFKAIGSPATVTLLFDEKKGRIGIKYPVSRDEHFFPARGYGRGRRLRIIRAARMIRQFGIEISETVKFADVEIIDLDDQPMLVLELGKGEKVNPGSGSTTPRLKPYPS